MHLVKWIRKNERKLMVFLLIFVMIAFVGGSALMQILRRFGAGAVQEVAHYGDKRTITNRDLMFERAELEVLKMLQVPQFLVSQQAFTGGPELKMRFLSQLLFADSNLAAAVNDEIKGALMKGWYHFSKHDIDSFFKQIGPNSDLYWLLLKAEAKQAGFTVSRQRAQEVLKQVIPALTQGKGTAAQLVNYVITRQRVPEEKIMTVFADFLAVLTYAQVVTGNENVTINQVKADIGRTGEKIDAEFVKFNAESFTDRLDEPTDEDLTQHFEKYKNIPAAAINQTDDFCFGYKLPPAVRVEFLAAKLQDVRKLVNEPTQNEMEKFYRENINNPQHEDMFKMRRQTDPNNPESIVERTKTYAELETRIKYTLLNDKTNSKAYMILNEAKDLTEAGFGRLSVDEADAEQLKELAGDYKDTAEKIAQKYNIKIYTGQTGMLSQTELNNDRYLSTLKLDAPGGATVALSKVLLAVDEAHAIELGRFDVAKPRMWANIGPVNNFSIIAILRITEARKETVPTDLNVTFSTKAMLLDDDAQDDEPVYSVRQKVLNDWKLKKAMETAEERAKEFVKLLEDKNWDQAITLYNERYAHDEQEQRQSEEISLEKMNMRTRISLADIKRRETMFADMLFGPASLQAEIQNKLQADKFYNLLPKGKTEALDIRRIVPFKPAACYYVVKDISRTAVTKQEYQQAKSITAFKLDMAAADSLAIVHFMPENILKRMNYRPAQNKEKTESPDNEKQSENPETSS